jgi:hypothetical protein
MSTLNVFALFHLNLAFSSIEEEQRQTVIDRCYWPLLRLPDLIGAPIAIEATGFTLETVEKLDRGWILELKRLVSNGSVEFIGSGYAQIIGPLVPARVNEENLHHGHQIYRRLLGVTPSVALINEQAYAAGLVPIYKEAGYQAVLMDWDNVASHHPEWDHELRYHLQRASGTNGSEIGLLWTHTMAFQKLQRFAHGDIELGDYLSWVASQRGLLPRILPLYSNDAETFDFRPGRFHTEEKLRGNEWARIAAAWRTLRHIPGVNFITPSQALVETSAPFANELLTLQTPDYPIPVKKQPKYNVTRWAVSGRDDLAINAACHRIHRALIDNKIETPEAWRELCYLWSSDFRTHITEKRWATLRERLAAAEAKYAGARRIASLAPRQATTTDERWIKIETPALRAILNRRRGCAIHEITTAGDNRPAMLGSLLHGHFDDIDLQYDWYTGNCVFEAAGLPKVTDLEWTEPAVWQDEETGDVVVDCRIDTPLGPINKNVRFSASDPRVEFDLTFSWKDWGRGSLRLGHFLLNPEAFDRSALTFRTHNGGRDAEEFAMTGATIDHGKAISFLVSAKTGLGMTEGAISIGDRDRRFTVEVDQTIAPLVGLIQSQTSGDTLFCRLMLSALELDDTRKPAASSEPHRFRFALTLS